MTAYIDFALKADSEAAMRDALRGLGYLATDESGVEQWVRASHTHALDPIGAIVKVRAVIDARGEVVTPAVLYAGWHANLRLFGAGASARAHAVRATGLALDPVPATPSVEWSG